MYIEFASQTFVNGKKIFRRITVNSKEEFNKLRKKYKNTDVYKSIFTYDNKDLEKAKILGPFCLDFDTNHLDEDTLNIMKKQLTHAMFYLLYKLSVPITYQKIYFSGNKGFHLSIDPEVFGLDYEDDNITKKYKTLATLIDYSYKSKFNDESFIDQKIYDKRRVFRLTGSINSKSGLYKIPISYEELRDLTIDSLLKLAEQPREIKYEDIVPIPLTISKWKDMFDDLDEEKLKKLQGIKERSSQKRQFSKPIKMLPCVKKILENGTNEGQRNNTSVALASCLFQMNKSIEEIKDIMISWNEKNNPPLSEYEIISTIISASNMYKVNRRYGCQTIKSLGLCTTKCKLFK